MSEWQPIESAPKDGRWVRVTGLDCDGRGGYWRAEGEARWDKTIPGGDWQTRVVAYPDGWMPNE